MTTEASEPRAIGADDRDLAPGQQVGEYLIEAKIGQGGFGSVFKANHPLIGKVVAIKVLNRQYSAQPEMVSRFVAEARAVNQIRNRYIIDIFGFGQLEDGRHYYVMEFLDGSPLDDFLDRHGQLTLADAIPILRSIARALDAAHAKGIAHRDLKPENIFLAAESDGTLFPKLLDFGIAKLLVADDQTKHKTRTGAPIGTPYYMSPEQCRGRDVDHRTDVYAFGCVTYKLLTGVVPFDGDDYMSILMKQMSEPVPDASERVPGLPPSIDQAIAWMMAKDPAQRPTSVLAAVRALEDAAVAAGLIVPPITAPMPTGPRTPSGLVPVPSRGLTPTPGLAGAATVDAAGFPGTTPGSLTPTPAPAPTTPVEPARPRRRVWTFVAATVGPVAAVVIAVVLIKGNAVDRAGIGAESGARSGGARMVAPPKLAQPTPSVEPIQPDPTPGSPGSPGHAGDDTGSGKTAPPLHDGVLDSKVTVTIAGLPVGTEVTDPDGTVIATATGGETKVELPRGDAEVKLGLHNEELGDGYVMVTPSANTVASPSLTRPTGEVTKVPGKKPHSSKAGKPVPAPVKPGGAEVVPGGNKSNTTERPDFGSKK